MDEPQPETMSRSDIRLVGQAARSRWPIPEDRKGELVTDLIATATTAEHDRDRVSAAKVLLELDRLNMEQEKRDAVGYAEQVKHHHEHTGQVHIDVTTLSNDQLERLARGEPID